MVKCKHQWDYVGNFTIGEHPIRIENPRFAKFVCPYCEEIKLIKISEGVERYGMGF